MTHYGAVFPLAYARRPMMNEIIKPVTILGASLFLITVLLLVFRTSLPQKPWLKTVLKRTLQVLLVLVAIMFCLLIPTLSGNTKGVLITVWQIGLFTSILVIILTPLMLIRSGYTAKIFAAAMLVICLMTVIQQIANLGYIRNFFINEHGIAMASWLESSIMAFGLFYHFYQEKKEKESKIIELEKEQGLTLKKLISVQNNERKRIAADLHDNIGPLLAALKINLRRMMNAKDKDLQQELMGKTELIIDDSIAEIRNVAHNLMPKGLSTNGLINTLHDYFAGIQQLYAKQVLFYHQVQSILNPDLQINLYRIICELVLNAAKYSCAHVITVNMMANDQLIYLMIRDDGNGFSLESVDKNSFGLQNEEDRVRYLKGKFSLTTQHGVGTTVMIEIPLQL